MNTPLKELTLTRLLDAPQDIVFRAWTDPEQLIKWWGPAGCVNTRCDMDLRPGGKIRIDMNAPDGSVVPMSGEVLEVDAPHKLVFTSVAFEDEQGRPGVENLITVIFTTEADKTLVTVHVAVTHASDAIKPALDGMHIGWNEGLDRMVAVVSA